jgi:hypothetical protein
MFSTCRISAKLGGTYLRLESAKNSSYSKNASTSLSGVKKEPCGNIRGVLMHSFKPKLSRQHDGRRC